ncbi:MAG: ACP phosphodiesterase [Bacteroidales bacterium]|jgi:acyl carrier protein phosphodiesterase|nr:ACP phosphodiesterase [Bacteroidales bacterium]
MNFIAHTYLSGCNEEIIVGNFMGDYVKGRNYMHLPELVRKGILIHRDIDSFTDTHSITRSSRMRLIEKYRKYSGVIVDIFYDHFLAVGWMDYCGIPLKDYVDRTYDLLKRNYKTLPQGIKVWFPTFLENNWMLRYEHVEGIELVLNKMSANTSLPDHTSFAIEKLRSEYDEFDKEFKEFFPLIIEFIEQKYEVDIKSQIHRLGECQAD